VSADGTYVVGESSSETQSSGQAFIWDQSSGMSKLGSAFASYAVDVSADGQYAVGTYFSLRTETAFRWFRGPPQGMTVVARQGGAPRTVGRARATSLSGSGEVVVGWESSTLIIDEETAETQQSAFRWTPAGKETISPPDSWLEPTGITSDGGTIIGSLVSWDGYWAAFRLRGGNLEDLGPGGKSAVPAGISADGRKIAGSYVDPNRIEEGPPPATGAFLWTEGAQPGFVTLRSGSVGGAGISADGRTIVDTAGGIYVDGKGPTDLREILAQAGVIDLRGLSEGAFLAGALSDNGLAIVGSALVDGAWRAWRVRLNDVDQNGISDEVEQFACGIYGDAYLLDIARNSMEFAASRETLGYGDMISRYGRPWKRGSGRTPERDLDQPAEFLRSLLRLGGCPDSVNGGTIQSSVVASQLLTGVVFPAVRELHDFEMLLGNEAFADALDPTIGLDGIPPDELSDAYAFRGVPGIEDLLDEELALLCGRQLPGAPNDWLNEAIYYPEFTGPGGEKRSVAVYHRLPPNAAADSGPAYKSNYAVGGDFGAAEKFPQGHGDAYGHYLSALKTGIGLLRDGPSGFPAQFFDMIADFTASDTGLTSVRRLAEAAALRAQCAAQAVDLLFRRDYREDPEDPHAADLFSDPEPERAWSMGDWARRGALGAYFDWALVSHWAPGNETRPVHRGNLPEISALSGAMRGFQERLDTAGAGLDPLGLIQNVVPFGIDASGLEPGSGRSHYEQVRDAASRALENARKTFEAANGAGQRLRDSDRAFSALSSQLEDTRADHDQQLVEIFGLPSPDDPQDNDLDPATTDLEESQSHPDLTGFMDTDEVLAAKGMRTRLAPGQVQLALSELRVAALRVEQAELALDELAAQIRSQADRIELLANVQKQRISIIASTCSQQESLTRRLEFIEERNKSNGLFSGLPGAIVTSFVTGNPSGIVDTAVRFLQFQVDRLSENEFDIEVERTRVQCWKEIKLQGLEDVLNVDAEQRQLESLLRRSPQLLVDVAVAEELAAQALGRLQQSIVRGQSLLREKRRLETRTSGDLLEERWKDMSFRIFRNAALKNYRAFFDIAARYVVLAARAYAYEFDARSDGDDALAGIYRQRRPGGAGGLGGGLQGVLTRLDGAVTVNNFNKPLESLGERSFSLRRNLLGIGVEDFPNDDRRFRAFLESNVVDRLQDLAEIRDLAQVSANRDFGPALVLSFATEIDSRNFFGRGPELPFGNSNFSITRNAKIRSYAIRLDGVDAALGTDPQSGTVFVYLLPVGDSVLRENTNLPVIEDERASPWAVVDQFLPSPPLAQSADLTRRAYSPWRSNAQSAGNFLGEIKRQRDSEAQIELGQPSLRLNTNLAGRSAWNTRWLLVIPGSQWTSSSDPTVIRRKLLEFIYGSTADPKANRGITDIRLIIQAYSH
jgi:hypothetical protein